MRGQVLLLGMGALLLVATRVLAQEGPKPFAVLEPSAEEGGFYSSAFSPDSRSLATAWSVVTIWDVTSGKRRRSAPGVFPVAWSPKGNLLAGRLIEPPTERVALLDADTLNPTLRIERPQWPKRPHLIAFSPDGKQIACLYDGADPARLIVWNVATAKEIATVKSDPVLLLGYTADGTALVGVGGEIKVWETSGYALRWSHRLRTPADTAAIAARGGLVATNTTRSLPRGDYGAPPPTELTVHVWDVRTGKEVGTVKHKAQYSVPVVFSPDGLTLATGGAGTVKLWDVATRKLLAEQRLLDPAHDPERWGSPSAPVCFSPDGKTLAVRILRVMQLWRVASLLEANKQRQ